MHSFKELIINSTRSTLAAFENSNEAFLESLKSLASTSSVKGLQMIQLQKVIFAIGMFSLFDSELQRELECDNGFSKASDVLIEKGEIELNKRFKIFILAINVLKHGKGHSYNKLIEEKSSLPFKIKQPNQSFFEEGDVSEVLTLIEVDDKFVLNCAELISQVSDYTIKT